MKKPFKVLYGKRVIIPFPIVDEKTDAGIILTATAQDAQTQEELNNFLKVEVIQRGSECERVEEGDFIYVPARIVQPGRSDMLTTLQNEKYLIVNEQDIVGKW